MAELRAKAGKDIALFGGGIPLLQPPADRTRLKLRAYRVYGKTGTVGLEDEIRTRARTSL